MFNKNWVSGLFLNILKLVFIIVKFIVILWYFLNEYFEVMIGVRYIKFILDFVKRMIFGLIIVVILVN